MPTNHLHGWKVFFTGQGVGAGCRCLARSNRVETKRRSVRRPSPPFRAPTAPSREAAIMADISLPGDTGAFMDYSLEDARELRGGGDSSGRGGGGEEESLRKLRTAQSRARKKARARSKSVRKQVCVCGYHPRNPLSFFCFLFLFRSLGVGRGLRISSGPSGLSHFGERGIMSVSVCVCSCRCFLFFFLGPSLGSPTNEFFMSSQQDARGVFVLLGSCRERATGNNRNRCRRHRQTPHTRSLEPDPPFGQSSRPNSDDHGDGMGVSTTCLALFASLCCRREHPP